MSNKAFEKFFGQEPKGAAKKEMFKQEKRKAKAARKAAGEAFRKKLWQERHGIVPQETNKKEPKPTEFKQKSRPSASNNTNTGYKKAKPSNNPNSQITPTAPQINRTTALEQMPLNKFVAHCGISGRREAAEIIKAGKVTVNGNIIFEPGFKVIGNEDVKIDGKKIFLQKNLVYVLLNKPKDFLTTTKDPQGRKTIFDLLTGATNERIYPVGRLDRNTTGVLLLTNDGELAQKLTHPLYEIKKVYEVKLDKPLVKKDLEAIASGINLEDGFIHADSIAYIDKNDKSQIGIEIHSGRNRIVRRIFEHLGYDVKGLDRVMFATLTKKNVDRGKWRFLQEKEIRILKFLNQSYMKKAKETKDTTKKAEPSTAEKIKKLKASYFNFKEKQLKEKELAKKSAK